MIGILFLRCDLRVAELIGHATIEVSSATFQRWSKFEPDLVYEVSRVEEDVS